MQGERQRQFGSWTGSGGPTQGETDSARGTSSVIGIILLIGVAVILGSVISVFALGVTDKTTAEAPTVSTSYTLVQDGDEKTIAVTRQGGEAIEADHLYVTGTKRLDIGGSPSSGAPADESYASSKEKFSEGADQANVGETWDAGETVYLDSVGSVDGVTVRIAWSSQPVTQVNPGTPRGDDSFILDKFTVGS
jgi:FlaG/FlaF family flagellin (archaellin)